MAKIENIRVVEQRTPSEFQPEDELEELGLPKPPRGEHPLDKEEVRARFTKVNDWWMQERTKQQEVRREAMRDHEIYDGPGQWTAEELEILKQRLQDPLVFNQVKPTVDWVLGTEKKARIDYRILPRGEEDAAGAETKTKVLKYVSDVNNTGFKRSQSFVDAVISGVGWLDHGISGDPDDEKIRISYEDWRNVWYDSLAVEADLSDARYVFRGKWVDEDVAIAYFPDRADVIHAAANQDAGILFDDPAFDLDGSEDGTNVNSTTVIKTGFFSFAGETTASKRRRVFLVEAWYRVPARKKTLRGKELGTLNGVTYDEKDVDHVRLVEAGLGEPVDSIQMEMRQMIFVADYVLYEGVSPFRHNRFPLVPIWGYRRKKDNAPYGMVRPLRDPQRDLNKRRSKALYILSTNKVITEEGAPAGTLNEMYDAVNRPDGVVLLKDGFFEKFKIGNERDLAQEHIALMEQDEKYIQNASGVTDELMGRDTNAVSGVAINARQEQGHVVTQQLFDNYRMAFKLSGEIQLSLIEQYYTEETVVRIIGKDNEPEFVPVNAPDPETGEIMNDITATQADFVVSEQDYSATIRRAMFETMSEMATKLPPEVAIQILDLIFELSDLPGKEKFVERIRQISGQKDPDAKEDPNAAPEVDPAAEAEAAAAQQQADIQNQILQTQLAAEQAKVKKLEQEAQLVAAKIKTESVNQQVSAAGVDYDREEIRIKKAQTLNAIETAEHGRKMMELQGPVKPGGDMVKHKDKQNGYTERGIKSNNKKK